MFHCLRIQYRTLQGDYLSAVQMIAPGSAADYRDFIRGWALAHLPEGAQLLAAETFWAMRGVDGRQRTLNGSA